MTTGENHQVDLNENKQEYEEFKPTFGISIVMTVLATVMTISGFLLFLLLFVVIGGSAENGNALVETGSDDDSVYFTIHFGNMLLVTLASLGVLVLHEAIHGAAFRYFGGRPIYGAMIVQKVMPVFYCSAPGYRFTRGQFAVIILAPLILISLLGIVLMPFVENGLVLVLPLAINFGGAVGDVWMAVMLLRRSPGTMIEDLKDGLRFHPPTSSD